MQPVKHEILCLFCGSTMPCDAIKCRQCGEFTDPKYRWKGVAVKPSLFQKTFCTHCYYDGSPKTITKGSILLELFLWCFIIPGFIYSGYRLASKTCVCKKCGSNQINKI